MKNTECTIYITAKGGWTQSYRKGEKGWTQTTNGVVHSLSAEQLLSHILPLLIIDNQKRFKVTVVSDAKREGNSL